MNTRELQYVLAIAKHQSITKAAQELYVSQPTLSKFLQRLEKDVGLPLFRRLGNKFYLTYAGNVFTEKAKQILELQKDLDNELSDILREDIGVLSIGFPIMRGTYMLPYTLPKFYKEYPLVRVNVLEADSIMLDNMILNGDVDMAFYNQHVETNNIDFEVISHEEIVLAAAPGHALTQRAVMKQGCNHPWIDIATTENEFFILQKRDQRTRQLCDKVLHEYGVKPKNFMEMRNILAAVQLAASGYGICFVTESHLKHIPTEVKPVVFSFGNPSVTSNFVAAYRKNAYLPTYAKAFINIVKEYV